MKTFFKVISGSFLIAGTTVGAGMLGIPLITSTSGFLPSVVTTILVWAFMLCTGLLYLEVTLWLPEGGNILTMSRKFLGRKGQFFSGGMFAFLYYALMIAYFAAGAPLLAGIMESVFGLAFSTVWSYIFFGLVFGIIIGIGPKMIDRTNIILTVGLVISLIWLLSVSAGAIDEKRLIPAVWSQAPFAAPILFSAFGFHNVVPPLTSYLKRNVKVLRLAILVGTLIPLIIYILWQWVIIGAIDSNVIAQTLKEGYPVTHALSQVALSSTIPKIGAAFAFFAIITSTLGVAFSLVDFLGDGFNVRRVGMSRAFLTLLTFIPPLIIAVVNPRIFDKALGIAGGFGEAYLNGLLPVVLVWIGRYSHKLHKPHMLPFGRTSLFTLGFFSFVVFAIEIVHLGRH
jgi:tyrosine-specific transport protein